MFNRRALPIERNFGEEGQNMVAKVDGTPAKHLSAASRRWVAGIEAEYELEDWHRRLLQGAAEQWDRAQEARATVAVDGAYVKDRFGQLRAHPGVAVQRDALTLFARLVRELNLDSAPDDARPPRIGRGRG